MIRYGFEREYWCIHDTGDYVLVPASIPRDECGYLAEARGEPHHKPIHAMHSLLAEEFILDASIQKYNISIHTCLATIKLDRSLLRKANRLHGKPTYPPGRGNLYGKDYSVNDPWQRAALHIHFSSYTEVDGKDGHKIRCHQIMDMPKIIRHMDEAFKKEIKETRRIPGCYELKPHGFEYRSLPTTVDLISVVNALDKLELQ